jgi:Leucine Rich Repeat (LRR) protein
MADVMAIVSKAVFEKAAGKSPNVGDRLNMDRYITANKALSPLAGGGKLYLVTVRPPNEALWLVGVLDHPTFDGTQWTSAPSPVPIVDISALRGQLKFESGKGITAAAGALGMSLQTPRVLAAHDALLLDAAAGTASAAPPPLVALETSGIRRQGDGLLQAIIDDPKNPVARQVFADAAMARNDPRGEYVMLELALAGPLGIRRREQLIARRKELFAANEAKWFATDLEYRLDCGFIAALIGSARKILKSAPAMFGTQPVTEVHATNIDAKVAKQLAAAPWLARVRHLVVKGDLGDAAFKVLVAAPGAQRLEQLNATACKVTAKGLASLAGHLPRLRSLVLTGNSVGDDGVTALRAWATLADLETLYLSSCRLTLEGVTDLLATPLPRLAKLTLSGNALGDKLGDVLADAAHRLPALQRLELKRVGASAALIDVVERAKLPQLRQIDLRDNRIQAKAVAGHPRFRAA